MKKIILLISLLSFFLIAGCASQSVEEIKTEDNIGETITFRGTVSSSFKIGDLSGYILEDNKGDTIGVSSDQIPEEGKTITVRGTLMRDSLFGYYILD